MLSKVRRYIDFNTAIAIYKTMILPVMEYGNVANSESKLLSKLQVLQNRALRITSVISMHQDSKVAKLEARRIFSECLFLNKN